MASVEITVEPETGVLKYVILDDSDNLIARGWTDGTAQGSAASLANAFASVAVLLDALGIDYDVDANVLDGDDPTAATAGVTTLSGVATTTQNVDHPPAGGHLSQVEP